MLKLNVPDMSCGHCVGAITEAVKSVDPAAEVKPDLASKTVVIESRAPTDKIMTAVDGAGYPNTVAG